MNGPGERRLLKEAFNSHAFVCRVPKRRPLFSGRILLLVSWHFSLPEIPLAWVWGFPDSLPDPAVISAPLRPQLLRAVLHLWEEGWANSQGLGLRVRL